MIDCRHKKSFSLINFIAVIELSCPALTNRAHETLRVILAPLLLKCNKNSCTLCLDGYELNNNNYCVKKIDNCVNQNMDINYVLFLSTERKSNQKESSLHASSQNRLRL